MKLPTVDEIENNKTAVLRLDLDLPISDGLIMDNSRLIKSVPTIRQLLAKKCRIIIIGHLGRPTYEDKGGQIVVDDVSREKLSLKPVYVELMSLLEDGEDAISSVFVDDAANTELIFEASQNNQIVFLENLRFYRQETDGQVEFFGHLAKIGNVFVNDALAVAHRKAASTMLFKLMPGYFSVGFAEEVDKMDRYLLNTKNPTVLVLGGVKEDKLKNLDILASTVDKVLIGGKLPEFFDKYKNIGNVVWAKLDESGMDIDDESVTMFEEEISKAGEIILAGTMGKYEDENHSMGTESVTKAIIGNSSAIKVGAGGDTKASLVKMGLLDMFDYVCSGGGVALEFLANKGKLPAWENY